MKRRIYFAMSLLLIASLLSITNLAFATPTQKRQPRKVRVNSKVEKGRSVGERVKHLRKTDKSVRGALEAFEKRGNRPKVDEATSITGTVTPENEGVAFRKASYNPRQTITGDGIELIFITALDLFNEWQGVAIANFYDATGALESSNVADVVITRSEYNPTEWTARYELKFESDGVGYLSHEPGMFTNFQLGTPIQQQSAPLYLLPEQFPNPEIKALYYETYPQQLLYDNLAPGAGDGGGEILILPARFSRLTQAGVVGGAALLGRVRVSGWRGFARDVGILCGSAAIACGLGSALFAGAPFLPCFTVGCSGSAAAAAAYNLRPRLVRP